MSRLLSLTRAARLVGARRGALQAMIQRGELATFEGMVSEEELLRVFPGLRHGEDPVLERIEALKDAAYSRRLRERVLPSADLLLARLTELGRELARAQARSRSDRDTIQALRGRLRALADAHPASAAIEALLAWLEEREGPAPDAGPAEIDAKERLLRIMSAHVQVRPSGHEFFVEGNDTLLEAALRAGLSVDYGCSGGTCGKCKAKVVSGEVRALRHSDYPLAAAEKAAGVVLMCCSTAVTDVVIEAREASRAADIGVQWIDTRVKKVSALGEAMRLVHLQTPRSSRLRFLAGQSVRLELPGGAARELPVASCPCDDRNLEFHVARQPGDAFCEAVFSGLAAGETVSLEGPRGDFVLDEESARPLFFIAAGTGFAPVKSLVEHAMALETAPSIRLAWVASPPGGHYLDNLCRSWSAAFDDFHYVAIPAEADVAEEAGAERAVQRALEALPGEAADHYVAGPDAFLAAARRRLPGKAYFLRM
jgi:CDP-4-dehydro-6-deoxyglucose reductase